MNIDQTTNLTEGKNVSINSQPMSMDKSNQQFDIIVSPTTGGQFEVSVLPNETVSELRKKIARQLRTPQERLKLLYKEKLLEDGTIQEHNIQSGSKITITPALESGFSSTTQGTQQSIVQAIEGLSDSQIDDFLAGHAPLTLALRVSDHVMFVQLQLEQARANLLRLQNSRTSLNLRTNSPCNQINCNHSRNKTASINSLKDRTLSRNFHDLASMDQESTHSYLSRSKTSSKSSDISNFKPMTAVHSHQKQESDTLESEIDSNRKVIRTTSGKITSGIGSLTQQGTSGTGSRFLRHMQRLGRLCGGHRQCVAYSSRELASEVSSIVQAAKHSDGSSHRRSAAKYVSRDGSSSYSTRLQNLGASIDSVTTHGPGIFSGTFSGILHPSIQDKDGRPKRDPQTVLQILTDLLSASSQHEGQSGSAGVLPQLFREHFAKNSSPLPNIATSSGVTTQASNQNTKHSVQQRSSKRSFPFTPEQRHFYKRSSSLPPWTPSPLPSHMSRMAAMLSKSSQTSSMETKSSSKFEKVSNSESSRRVNQFMRSRQSLSWISVLSDKRFHKHLAISSMRINNKLKQENLKTCHKVHTLRQMMALKRKNRQERKQTSGLCHNVPASAGESQPVRSDAAHGRKTSLELQIERKAEMKHDSGETVTV